MVNTLPVSTIPPAPSPVRWVSAPLQKEGSAYTVLLDSRNEKVVASATDLHTIATAFNTTTPGESFRLPEDPDKARIPKYLGRSVPEGEKRLYSVIDTAPFAHGGYAEVYDVVGVCENGKIKSRVLKVAQPESKKFAVIPMVQHLWSQARRALTSEVEVLDKIHKHGYQPGVIPAAELLMKQEKPLAVYKRYDADLGMMRHELNSGEKLDAFGQVISAVAALHKKGVILSDLKPANILVKRRDPDSTKPPLRVDLGDMGDCLLVNRVKKKPQLLVDIELGLWSKEFMTLNDYEKCCALLKKLRGQIDRNESDKAQECLKEIFQLRRERDVFATAASFYYLFTSTLPQGRTPLSGLCNTTFHTKDGMFFDSAPLRERNLPEGFIKLLSDMCKHKSSQRPTAEQVVERLAAIDFGLLAT